MPTLNIAYLADRPEAIPVLAEWFAREWGGGTGAMSTAAIAERLRSGAGRERLPICLLGTVDDDPVATATLKFREIEHAPDADYWLGSVYVREDARGEGYGRAIISAAAGVAKARRFTPLYLYAPRKELLYRRLGWEMVGTAIADGKQAAVMRPVFTGGALNVLGISGSPREKANSHILLEQSMAPFVEAGWEATTLRLRDLTVEPCRACDFCPTRAGACKLEDDMGVFYEAFRACGALVVASPVYSRNVCAQLMAVFNRHRAVSVERPLAGKAGGARVKHRRFSELYGAPR